jgi:hypothetical protein
MKGVWKWSLSLSLGLLTGAAWADEVKWRAAVASPTPPAQAGVVSRWQGVTLGKPMKASETVADPQVKPVSFSPTTVRGQDGEPLRLAPRVGLEPEPLGQPKALDVPPGTVVLPHGTILPPGATLPPNVIIAPAPAAAQPMPHGPLEPVPDGSPEFSLTPALPADPCAPGEECPPFESCLPPEECCEQGEVCGEPEMCYVTAESCCECECCPCVPGLECYRGNQKVWASADYLMWWTRGNNAPPLASTGPIGVPGTRVLFGGGDIDRNFRSGFRFDAGMWLHESQCLGFQVGGLFLPRLGNGLATAAAPLVRPFLNLDTGLSDAEFVAIPGVTIGGLKIDSDNWLWGGDVNVVSRIHCGPNHRVVALLGFRYLGMEDSLTITESPLTLVQVGDTPPGTSFLIQDSFETRNHFYGGQLGLQAEMRFGKFVIDMRGKCALGSTVQTVNINGTTRINGGPPLTGGLLAQASNIGTRTQSKFSVVPEGAVNLGYQVTDSLQVYVGYTFLYWSNVARSGDQIDPRVNGARLPSRGQVYPRNSPPLAQFRTTDFWAQGINFGMQLSF